MKSSSKRYFWCCMPLQKQAYLTLTTGYSRFQYLLTLKLEQVESKCEFLHQEVHQHAGQRHLPSHSTLPYWLVMLYLGFLISKQKKMKLTVNKIVQLRTSQKHLFSRTLLLSNIRYNKECICDNFWTLC